MPNETMGDSWAAARRAKVEAKERRQDQALKTLVETEGRVGEMRSRCGVPTATWELWMRDQRFNARVRQIKAQFFTSGARSSQIAHVETFEEYRLRYFKRHTYSHQSQLVRILDSVQPREIVLVLIHPEAGKTATMEDWVCKKIGDNPDIRISYLTESQDLSKKVLGFVKGRMTEPDWVDYQIAHGPFYVDGQERNGKPWTTSYITVARSTHQERDYTFQTRAVTSRAYGSRIDLLIGDDIQSRETYTQTDKIFTHLRQTYFTRGKKMTMVFVGTRIGPGDIYERMLDSGLVDRHVILPATEGDNPAVPEAWADPDDYPDDPEAFREAARINLGRIRRQVGEEVWWASYQQSPMANELASFSQENIENAKDFERSIDDRPTPGSLIYLSLDPALGGMNALLASEFREDRMVLLDLQTDTAFAQTEQILAGIQKMATRFQPQSVVIEQNAFQKGLANDVRLQQMGKALGFRVIPHLTGREKSDPILGVAAMAGSFNSASVRIPWGDEASRTRFGPLVHQLGSWRPNVPPKLLQQDAVMALWFGWKQWQAWQTALAKRKPQQRAWRPSWMRAASNA